MAEDKQDEMRLCPTCRMPISVLATRCRYCGEKVGRPKKEEERFTAQDLGGDQKTTYTLSGNVMDALESFRAEVLGKTGGPEDPDAPPAAPRHEARVASTGVPEVDAKFKNLAELLDVGPSRAPKAPVKREPAMTQRLFTLGAIIAGLILIYLTTDFAWARIKDYMEQRRRANEVVIENNTGRLLAEGKTLEALNEANSVIAMDGSEENRALLEQARAAFSSEIRAVLEAEAWSQAGLREASRRVAQATLRDKSPAMMDLMQRVDEDIAQYKLVLRSVDTAGGKAVFIVHAQSTGEREQTVAEGDYVAGRFLVKRIQPNLVRLEDTQVAAANGYRAVVCRTMSPAEPAS